MTVALRMVALWRVLLWRVLLRMMLLRMVALWMVLLWMVLFGGDTGDTGGGKTRHVHCRCYTTPEVHGWTCHDGPDCDP